MSHPRSTQYPVPNQPGDQSGNQRKREHMPTFGKKASERQASGGGGGRDYYLKTFKEKITKIRPLHGDPNHWVQIVEHYDKANNISYPCAKYEGAEDCIGCSFPVEHPEWADLEASPHESRADRAKADPGWGVRDGSYKWIFPALDEKGYISVYKIGKKFYEDIVALHALTGDLSQCDYAVIRAGDSFNTTSYQLQAISQPYAREIKTAVPTEEVISDVLGKKYTFAMQKYGYDVPATPDEALPNPAPVTDATPAVPDPAPVADEAQAAPAPAPAPAAPGALDPAMQLPVAEHVESTNPGDPVADALAAAKNARADAGLPGPAEDKPLFIPRESDSGTIKDWLKEHEVEFAARAPRTVLVGLAEAKMKELGLEPAF